MPAIASLAALCALPACAPVARTVQAPAQAAVPRVAATVSAGELAAMLAGGDVTLIDVRTPEEFASGHISGARNVPLDAFSASSLAPGDQGKVVLYCRSGRRSQVAADRLVAEGATPATQLDGGILAWEAAGLPLGGGATAHGAD